MQYIPVSGQSSLVGPKKMLEYVPTYDTTTLAKFNSTPLHSPLLSFVNFYYSKLFFEYLHAHSYYFGAFFLLDT